MPAASPKSVVGKVDGLPLGRERHRDEHGPKDLFIGDAHCWIHVPEDGGTDEETVGRCAFKTAGDQVGPVCDRALDVGANPLVFVSTTSCAGLEDCSDRSDGLLDFGPFEAARPILGSVPLAAKTIEPLGRRLTGLADQGLR